MKRTGVVAAAAMLLTSAGAQSAPAASSPSGDPAAIGFYRAVAQAYDSVTTLTYTQTGLVAMRSSVGKVSSFSWSFRKGFGAGFVPARERATVALRDGRVLWVRDDLDAPAGTGYGPTQVPFEVVYDSAGLFGRWRLSGKRHACYIRLSGTAPFPALGAPWLAVAGLFSPLSITGDSVRVTSRYGYPDGRLATEIDTVSSQTHLIRRAWVSVPGSGSDAAVISFARYGYPAADAPAPRVTLCRRAQ